MLKEDERKLLENLRIEAQNNPGGFNIKDKPVVQEIDFDEIINVKRKHA